MDQISPPMRIALLVVVIFAAAYILVLRPKDEAIAPAPAPAPATAPAADAGGAPAGTDLGKAVEGAREAAGAAGTAAKERAGETQVKPGGPSTTQAAPAPSAETAPAEPDVKPTDAALADLPKWLRESMDRKVVALLFTNGESADDRRTERALENAYDGDGQVVTRSVNVLEIAKYRTIAEDLDVSQSPTLMVIARDRTADAMSGFASIDRINQMIIDGLLATENPVDEVPFFELAQSEGRRINNMDIIGVTEGSTPDGARKNVSATLQALDGALGKLRNAPVPNKHQDVKNVLIDYVEAQSAFGKKVLDSIGPSGINYLELKDPARNMLKIKREALLELNAVGVSSWN